MNHARLPRWWSARVVLCALGLGLIADAGWLALTANLSVGTLLAAAMGVALVVWGWLLTKAKRWMNVLATVIFGTVLGFAVFLAICGSTAHVDYREQAVIVLGAAVHGDELSTTLQARLDTADEYWTKNPAAIIVVSGGQGFQEDLPEAEAMRQYLIGRGIPESQIVVESSATSTEENFSFSKKLLDARLAPGYQVAFVTDEFHVCRASRIASDVGLVAHAYPRSTLWYVWAPNFLREEVAILSMWLLGSTR